MKINCFSVTFWFNAFNGYDKHLETIRKELSEFNSYSLFDYSDNLFAPILTAVNDKLRTNITFSQINVQYNMDMVSLDDVDDFSDKVLNLFNLLNLIGIETLHTAIFLNCDMTFQDALKKITKNTISKAFLNDDLVDINFKIGKKHENLFYKIVTILNKKELKLPKLIDNQNRVMPIPLISWKDAIVGNEIVEISYEINDKYSFDFTQNYQTTEFYLNKMLYLFKNDFEDDIKRIIEKGEF